MKRRRLPDERQSITHKFTILGLSNKGTPRKYTGYLTVGLYDDGTPGEIFVRFAKLGGREGCLLDAWCTMVSIALQSGVPLENLMTKFRGWQFEPQGLLERGVVRQCTSPLDYICQWLVLKFCGEAKDAAGG